MIKPSEVNTSGHFWNSSLEAFEYEIIAHNISQLNKALAYQRDDDRWQPFTIDEYETFRSATSQEPVNQQERSYIDNLANRGYLEVDASGTYTVTNRFLGVVVQFAHPEATQAVIAGKQ